MQTYVSLVKFTQHETSRGTGERSHPHSYRAEPGQQLTANGSSRPHDSDFVNTRWNSSIAVTTPSWFCCIRLPSTNTTS